MGGGDKPNLEYFLSVYLSLLGLPQPIHRVHGLLK